MAKPAYKSSNGKPLLGSGGKPAWKNTCACCCECASLSICPECGACTPTHLTVTFAGVTMCACTGDGTTSAKVQAGGLDGTYVLTQFDNCRWAVSTTGPTIRTFPTADCSGAVWTEFDDLTISVERTAGGYVLLATAVGIKLFEATLSPAAGTCGSASGPNDLGGCVWNASGVPTPVLGHGGSAIVTRCAA